MNTLQEIAETLKFNAVNCVAENDLADALLTLEVLREAVFKAVDAIAALEPLSQAEGQEPVAWRRRLAGGPDGVERREPEFTANPDLPAIWKDHPRTIAVDGLYTHPAETRSGQSIAAPSRVEVIEAEPKQSMTRHPAYYTFDERAFAEGVGTLYYFAPLHHSPPPYRTQLHVTAIIDVAADGTLGGVELIDDMPLPPAVDRALSPSTSIAMGGDDE